MFLNKRGQLFTMIVIVFSLGGSIFYFQDMKEKELKKELEKVELHNVKTGVGTSKGKLGTAIFGEILNNGKRTIKIAKIKIFFLSESGEAIKEKNFFPVNNYSFSDSSPLRPGESKKFGFPIDDIVPEKWSGVISSKIVDLKYK